jgi:transcriptional regulator with XRE-family HTH domain
MAGWRFMARIPASNRSDRVAARDPELVALGARVRALRAAAGMTQERLAAAADVHWTYVGQIERGERNPTYKNLRRLAAGLGIRPGRLLEDDGP